MWPIGSVDDVRIANVLIEVVHAIIESNDAGKGQRAFNRFRQEYNEERPHRSLGGGRRPSEVFRSSPRSYPATLPEVAYPQDFVLRKVKPGGYMKWHGQIIYVTKALEGEYVGLKPLDHDRWELYFARLPLGVFDARSSKIIKPR